MGPAAYLLSCIVRFYSSAISPYTLPRCRFLPTCSNYTLEALRRYGASRGAYLSVRRLLRCHPWGGSGCDPVP